MRVSTVVNEQYLTHPRGNTHKQSRDRFVTHFCQEVEAYVEMLSENREACAYYRMIAAKNVFSFHEFRKGGWGRVWYDVMKFPSRKYI